MFYCICSYFTIHDVLLHLLILYHSQYFIAEKYQSLLQIKLSFCKKQLLSTLKDFQSDFTFAHKFTET